MIEFGCRRRILGTKLFQKPHPAQGKTSAETLMAAFADYKLGAAAAHIENQQRFAGQRGSGGDSLKHPVRLLLTGNDFQREASDLMDSRNQFRLIERVARRA